MFFKIHLEFTKNETMKWEYENQNYWGNVVTKTDNNRGKAQIATYRVTTELPTQFFLPSRTDIDFQYGDVLE